MAKFLPDTYSKVLDIGCGTGYFSSNLSQPCEYWGIEPFGEAAQMASQILDNVLIGTFEEVHSQLPENYFDLVICNHVIEHMPDHDWFFTTLKKKMKDGAYIIGSIPSVRYIGNLFELLVKKDWIYKDAGTLDRTHLRFFTEKSLKRSFIENNFIIEKFHGMHKTIPKSVLKGIIKEMLIYLVGRDSQFFEFGFRLKYSKPY